LLDSLDYLRLQLVEWNYFSQHAAKLFAIFHIDAFSGIVFPGVIWA
jgi:hypothetical protein